MARLKYQCTELIGGSTKITFCIQSPDGTMKIPQFACNNWEENVGQKEECSVHSHQMAAGNNYDLHCLQLAQAFCAHFDSGSP